MSDDQHTQPELNEAKAEIRAKLLQALPHFRFAMKEAAEKGRPQVGILAVQPNGSGNVIAQFDAPEFFEDLAVLIDAPAQTEDDELDEKAVQFLDRLGLGR